MSPYDNKINWGERNPLHYDKQINVEGLTELENLFRYSHGNNHLMQARSISDH